MTVRVATTPAVLRWALSVSAQPEASIRERFAVDAWQEGVGEPTFKQLQAFANATGVPFGYLLLDAPPEWRLPIPDFREGFGATREPSANLLAVLNQSLQRQSWYRDHALEHGMPPVDVVGSAASSTVDLAAADIRRRLGFEVPDRHGSWADTRKAMLRGFEALGGLTVATSMVGNNTHRLLDPDEFRGFSLVDEMAPLIFVNTHQTLNGQIFTLAHEFAHVWRGRSGVGNEDIRVEPQSEIERWCNAVAAEVLVPRADLAERYDALRHLSLTEQLESLGRRYRCGTLVVLQAMRRAALQHFDDFDAVYEQEMQRLSGFDSERGPGGDHYNNQPFRVGERLSRAIVADALEGRTPLAEAMALMSMKSLSSFDEYARRLGAA